MVPLKFSEPYATTDNQLTSKEICQLTVGFNQWLEDSFSTTDTPTLITARANYVDLILTKLWSQQGLDKCKISLLAVGGYGRGELHPYSDIDILLLTQDKISSDDEEKISLFITQLWDVKLDIGQSVRSVKECLKQSKNDVTVATNLMEMRFVCGNQSLAQTLQPALNKDNFWTSKKFFIAKRDEQILRHEQYLGAAYTLEPNLKSNPGALRDIQTIGWVAKKHFSAESLGELVEHEYLTRNEYSELLECQDYLWRMRFALHFVAKRSENRLLFDYQADVATFLGFGDVGKFAVERMMKRFFLTLSRVTELNNMLLQHFEQATLMVTPPTEVAITNDFCHVGGLIKITNDRLFMRSFKIMEMFLIIAQNPEITDIHSHTIRLLRNTRRRLISGICDYAEARRLFIEIIRHPRGLGVSFSLMYRYGIIGAYLPQWRNIVGQMQFDLFHAYSVDEHSYRLIKNLYRFSQEEYNHEFPLCSKIVQRNRKPDVLFLAGIFHDIAKGRGGDHSKLGAIDALEFSKTHKLNAHDGRMIAWLVTNHLVMSVTAQRRDISNETVISDFADIVRDEAHLDFLYCLTVADMRATNESLWNSWKDNLLKELYANTKKALRRGLEKPVDSRGKIRENQQLAIAGLLDKGIEKPAYQALWKDCKADYFLRYAPNQIVWHTQKLLDHDSNTPLVIISDKAYRGGTEVFIYTKIRANIFASTVELLSSKQLSILDAKILTSKSGYTLNTFVVLDQQFKPISDPDRAQSICNALSNIIDNNITNEIKTYPVSQRLQQFKTPTRVNISKSNNKNISLLEISAINRPALLASIALVFQKCKIKIHSAKITTFGEKAEDVFTLSSQYDLALTEEEQEDLTRKLCEEIA